MTHRLSALIVTFAAVIAALVATSAPAFACSCMPVTVEQAIFPDTAAAFVGVPVDVRENPDADRPGLFGQPLVWTFEVETVLYGEVPALVEVGSGMGGGDCGYDFTDAGRIGIVAYGEPGQLATGICGGVWGADELVAAHGPGVPAIPVSEGPLSEPAAQGPPVWFWWGLGGVGAMTLGLVVIGRRRRSTQDGWAPGPVT